MANSRLSRTNGKASGPPITLSDVAVASRAAHVGESLRDSHYRVSERRGHVSGFTLVELIAAAAMLAVLLATSLKMLHVLGDQQQAADRRVLAEQAVEVVGEQIGNLPWDQLTTEAAKRIAIPAQLSRIYPVQN